MQQALRDTGIENPVYHLEDGQAAIDYLQGAAKYADRAKFPLPMIVFLDLKLPLKSGHDVLAWIRTQPRFETIVVIVFTSSDQAVDLKRSYQLGANSYVVKLPAPKQLLELAEAFKLWWLKQNRVAAE